MRKFDFGLRGEPTNEAPRNIDIFKFVMVLFWPFGLPFPLVILLGIDPAVANYAGGVIFLIWVVLLVTKAVRIPYHLIMKDYLK